MGAILNKLANFIGFDSVEESDEDVVSAPVSAREEKVVKFNDFKNKSSMSKIPTSSMASYDIEHIIIAPTKFDDAKEIADEIKLKKIITLNMSVVGNEIAQRILDFISGTAYAVDSKITKVADNVFISVPSRVKQVNRLPSKEPVNEVMREKNDGNTYDETEEIIRSFSNTR